VFKGVWGLFLVLCAIKAKTSECQIMTQKTDSLAHASRQSPPSAPSRVNTGDTHLPAAAERGCALPVATSRSPSRNCANSASHNVRLTKGYLMRARAYYTTSTITNDI